MAPRDVYLLLRRKIVRMNRFVMGAISCVTDNTHSLLGNVSWVVPSVMVYTYYCDAPGHSKEWVAAGKSEAARESMISGAAVMAATAYSATAQSTSQAYAAVMLPFILSILNDGVGGYCTFVNNIAGACTFARSLCCFLSGIIPVCWRFRRRPGHERRILGNRSQAGRIYRKPI
jgi:hypothetical protein